ncbi:MAG: hypothetical protein HUU10_10000 [Bacteroidetes bacterium]|nr:hypothetical protein [Bacteroidota bacterium]
MNIRENPFILFMLGWQAYLFIVLLAVLGILGAGKFVTFLPESLSAAMLGAAAVLMIFRIIVRLLWFRS